MIPLGARIFSVVDTFDAMTSDRPYRAALSIDAAREEIREWSGRQFDPDVADAFLGIEGDAWREIRERVHREVMALEERVRRVLG
jgi:HD-GYP domain-containing protein (c-di-GMP phosphodiesterase class II)